MTSTPAPTRTDHLDRTGDARLGPGPRVRGHRGTPRARRAALAATAALLLLAGCSGDDAAKWDDGVSSGAMPAPYPGMAPGMEPSPEVGIAGDARGGTVVSPTGGRPQAGRAIIRSASLELVVDDGATAVSAVEATALDVGGYVAATSLSRAEDGTVSGSLTLRVPAERLDEVVERLDALARAVPLRSVGEYDVTMQLSDLDALLVNLRAYETELRALLTEVREQGGRAEDLLAVSDRLRQVRAEIDAIDAQRTRITDDVAYSTVNVWVTQARSTTPVVGTWDLPGVVRDALAATARLGQLAVEGMVWFALTVLPALAVLALVVIVVRALRRRRSRRVTPAGS